MYAAGALAVLLLAGWLIFRGHRAPSQADAEPSVAIATVRYGPYEERVSVSGRVGTPAGAQTKPAFALGGVLATIDVHVGEPVRAGQPLAELDAAGLAMAARQAQADAAAAAASFGGGDVPNAQLQTAQAKLVLARQRLAALQAGGVGAQTDRIAARAALRQSEIKSEGDRQAVTREQRLYAAGVAARKELDAAQSALAADLADQEAMRSKLAAATTGVGGALAQARADYAQAISDVRAAQAQRTVLGQQALSAGARAALAQRDYRNGTLVAPIDGVVTAIYKHPGEAVDPTTAVIGIGPASQNVVTLDVPANEARRIAIGDAVEVRIPGRTGAARGRVTGIAPAVDPATQSSTVVVNATPAGALSGDAVEASIVVARDRGLIVPQSSIVEDPQTGDTVCFIQSKDKDGAIRFQVHKIRVVKSDGSTAEILGLRPGQRIAAQGAFQLLAPAGPGE
ncbi:MAG: efflux RND transporter periplasmic adaptor subunit [Vulcanimicrobiaceae bacterium]